MGCQSLFKALGAAAALGIAGCSEKTQPTAVAPVPNASPVNISMFDELKIGAKAARVTAEYALNGGMARDGKTAKQAFKDSYYAQEYAEVMKKGAGVPDR